MRDFLPGYNIKPNKITETGEVTFTNGTSEVMANQQQCEAYGYTYNRVDGTCSAFKYSTKLVNNFRNERNNIQGSQNVTGEGANNTFVMGESNLIQGNSRNSVIIGSNNEIKEYADNASVLGNYGVAYRAGEIVFGGGGFTGAGKGKAQSSILALTGTTTDESPTSLFVNGDINTTAIARNVASYLSFEAKVIGVRTGGTAAGSDGDRIFLTTTGIVYETTANESTPVIVSTGTVAGWTANMDFSGSDLLFQVTGAADMNISWSCTLHIYEMIT